MTETKPIIDSEFTDIITESSLLSNDSSNPPEFTTIITETVIVSSSSESSEKETESPENLIKRYDELFNTPEEYIKFVNQKLTPWTNTLEFQHFDLHYCRHRADTHNIRAKRAMAQKLLEEADRLQKDHDYAQKRFHRFIATMTRQNLKNRLYKPRKINEDQTHPRLERRAQRLPNPPLIQTPRIEQRPRNNQRHISTPRRIYKCFKCESTEHLMYHCPQYRCYNCRRLAPGHRATECPQKETYNEWDENDQYGDYDPDGNLNGEC